MARSVPEWIGKTDDTPVPTRVKDRVFLTHGGRCYLSGRKIMPGDHWDAEHVLAICNGGQNRESNLRPALRDKHREKTTADVAIKSKTYRMRAKNNGTWPKSKTPLRSGRGFAKTRPVPEVTDLDDRDDGYEGEAVVSSKTRLYSTFKGEGGS
ncbi:HNH endonuclease [Brevundimonas sp.]